MPIAVTLWYMTMDITDVIAGGDITWELRKLVSLYSGLLMIGIAFWVDIRSRHRADYAFWLYIFGVITFWGGLSSQSSDDELSKFIYFCINLLMIGIGALLIRRVFVVFGALGSCGYLGYLAFDVFSDSWLFPMTLTAIGFGVVYLGILWQKMSKQSLKSHDYFFLFNSGSYWRPKGEPAQNSLTVDKIYTSANVNSSITSDGPFLVAPNPLA